MMTLYIVYFWPLDRIQRRDYRDRRCDIGDKDYSKIAVISIDNLCNHIPNVVRNQL
jgi:hypothetical protein